MFNRLPQISLIYNRYKNASLTKAASVEIRVSYNRKQKYLSTGIKVYSNQWRNGRVVNTPDALPINNTLDVLVIRVREIIHKMVSTDTLDIFKIQDFLEGEDRETRSFIDFCKERAKIRMYGKTKGSQIRYNRFIRFFFKWGKITTFKDITELNIIAYDEYLKKKGLKTSSKWNNYHRFLNSFIIDAIEAGYLKRNPYKYIDIDKSREDSLSKCLSIEEFHSLKTVKLPTLSLERVRDVFIFQTYTCLSYEDLKNFNISDTIKINSCKVYVGSRSKTKKTFTIPLLPPALDILAKYGNKLPVLSNTKYNEYLKIVAQAAGIDKPVSSHWARHTGATLLLNEGVNMNIVSKICGHSSTKITEQVYAKLLDETVVNAVASLDI